MRYQRVSEPRLVALLSRGYDAGQERAMITLTQEQARGLAETAESPPRVVDPRTQLTYFLVSGEVYARAHALFEEEQDVLGMFPLLAELDPEDWQDRAEQ
jgi:hypothetical protein